MKKSPPRRGSTGERRSAAPTRPAASATITTPIGGVRRRRRGRRRAAARGRSASRAAAASKRTRCEKRPVARPARRAGARRTPCASAADQVIRHVGAVGRLIRGGAAPPTAARRTRVRQSAALSPNAPTPTANVGDAGSRLTARRRRNAPVASGLARADRAIRQRCRRHRDRRCRSRRRRCSMRRSAALGRGRRVRRAAPVRCSRLDQVRHRQHGADRLRRVDDLERAVDLRRAAGGTSPARRGRRSSGR